MVPDIPLEETYAVREVCDKHGIELVLLATPTTPVARMEKIAKASQVGRLFATGTFGHLTEGFSEGFDIMSPNHYPFHSNFPTINCPMTSARLIMFIAGLCVSCFSYRSYGCEGVQ